MARSRLRGILEASTPCRTCHGEGWVERVVPAHDPACDGSCLYCPVPVREQEQCDECRGTGRVTVEGPRA